MDKAYPSGVAIRVVLDNHSAHISKETRAYLNTMPNRFEFIFTPKHGSWLNLIENFFANLKQFRAIATRYDKTARNFLAAIYFAASILWLV